MDFGKLQNIEAVDWTIPADDPLTLSFLSRFKTSDMPIYFGAPAWAHKSWIDKIYPHGAKREDFLFHYSRQFTCIELNTVHYRIPLPDQTARWARQVPANFLFCPKIYQALSHAKNGLLDRQTLEQWLAFLTELGGNCGPSFLQLPPHFSYSDKALLFGFLKNWPDAFSLSLEFRHPSWFAEGRILPALTEYLQSRRIGLVITDVAGRRDVLHTSISSDFSMLRFVGNGLHETDYSRAEAWSRYLTHLRNAGLQRFFLFIHEPDDILVPEMTRFFLQRLSDAGGWKFNFDLRSSPQLIYELFQFTTSYEV